MKDEILKQLQREKRNALKAQSFYLGIRIEYAQRLGKNRDIFNYVLRRYETAKENVDLAHRKVMNYLKGI